MYEQDENENEKEIEIIMNTADDKSLLQNSITLQHDYIVLSESSENLSDFSSENNSEKSDYSL